MTQDEADAVAAIIQRADGGCSSCVSHLCDLATQAEFGFVFKIEGDDIHIEWPSDWDPEEMDGGTYPNVVARAV